MDDKTDWRKRAVSAYLKSDARAEEITEREALTDMHRRVLRNLADALGFSSQVEIKAGPEGGSVEVDGVTFSTKAEQHLVRVSIRALDKRAGVLLTGVLAFTKEGAYLPHKTDPPSLVEAVGKILNQG